MCNQYGKVRRLNDERDAESKELVLKGLWIGLHSFEGAERKEGYPEILWVEITRNQNYCQRQANQ